MVDEARVEWSIDPSDSRTALFCLYALCGLGGGLVLLFVGGILFFGVGLVVASVQSGDYGTLALVVLLALVGGPFSLLYLVAAFADSEKRPTLPLLELCRESVDLGRLAVAVALGVVAGLALVSTGFGLLLLVLIVLPVLSVVVGVHSSDGELDAGRGTLRVRRRGSGDGTVNLNDLNGYRRFDVGDLVLFRFSYEEGYGGLTAPFGVGVPSEVASAVERAIEAGVDASARDDPDGGIDASGANPLVRPLLVGFGLLFVGLALSLGFLGPESYVRNLLGLLFPASLLCLFGVVFLLAAYFQGR